LLRYYTFASIQFLETKQKYGEAISHLPERQIIVLQKRNCIIEAIPNDPYTWPKVNVQPIQRAIKEKEFRMAGYIRTFHPFQGEAPFHTQKNRAEAVYVGLCREEK